MFVKELVPFHWLPRLSSSRCYHDLSTGQEVEKQNSAEDVSLLIEKSLPSGFMWNMLLEVLSVVT